MPDQPRILPFGDGALLVVLGEKIDPTLNRRVHALAAAILAHEGWDAPVPAYASLLVPYDPESLTVDEALEALRRIVSKTTGAGVIAEAPTFPVVEVGVRYGGEDGPDLLEVAAMHGLTAKQVVELHAGTTYQVFMLGFAPGFAYLGILPPALVTPRRAAPRPSVRAGSVGLAGNQTGIYPIDTPGGWQIIGRTDLRLWDPRRDPPTLLAPGQLVRFVPWGGPG
jgi:KipI family sensor histidine kinase inhibitor